MHNCHYKDNRELLFSGAALAVDKYLLDNAERKEIPDTELLELPEVAALVPDGEIPEGYFSEINKRVKKAHAETEEVKELARKELGVTDFVNKFSLTELKTL